MSKSETELFVSEFEKNAETKKLIMSDDTPIRILKTEAPKDTSRNLTLLLVAGWGTIVPSWDKFLIEAMKDFDIIYFESREKSSCGLTRKSQVGMERMAYDIKDVIDKHQIDENKLILFGSCLGATTIAFGMYKEFYDPIMPVLIAPPPRFEVPPVLRQLIPFAPHWLLALAKPIVIWWIKKFKTENAEQSAKYIRNLEEADGWRWKRVGLRLAFKRYWKIFPEIHAKSLLVAAEDDKMHDADNTKKIAKMMKNSIYVNLGTNKNTHEPIMVEKIREYLPVFFEN